MKFEDLKPGIWITQKKFDHFDDRHLMVKRIDKHQNGNCQIYYNCYFYSENEITWRSGCIYTRVSKLYELCILSKEQINPILTNSSIEAKLALIKTFNESKGDLISLITKGLIEKEIDILFK